MSNGTAADLTGWVWTKYVWTSNDNVTWISFFLYQLYYTFILLYRFHHSSKWTAVWKLMLTAICLNFGAALSGLVYLDCSTFNLRGNCTIQRRITYIFELFLFLSSYILLWYRKSRVVASSLLQPGILDATVMVVCIICSLTANVPCIVSTIEFCFAMDVFQASGATISFIYFDLLYMFLVSKKSFTQKQKAQAFELSFVTGSMSAVYLLGSISYKTWGGNFYTNLLWNMGWCLLPLFSIESVMSPNFTKMFETKSLEADTKGTAGHVEITDFLPQPTKAKSLISLSSLAKKNGSAPGSFHSMDAVNVCHSQVNIAASSINGHPGSMSLQELATSRQPNAPLNSIKREIRLSKAT
ncbi:hypothetical protein BC830DRAFT_1103452 [Chytriomyces sp. MP71]|nr:hypothetical protein BC830DRAFT_1103452 [Chytriomyces sp. MP71]